MAKTKQKIWPHTEEELWEILLDYCSELGHVPSRRSLQKYNLLNTEELLAVLGKGQGWPRIEGELNRRFKVAFEESSNEIPVLESPPKLEVSTPEMRPELISEVVSDSQLVRRGRKASYSYDKVLGLLKLAYEKGGSVRVPRPVDLQALHRDDPTIFPVYKTYLDYLGPREAWEELIRK